MFHKCNYTFILLILVSTGRARPTQHEGDASKTGIKEADAIMVNAEADLKDVEKLLEDEEKNLKEIMPSDGPNKDEIETNDAADPQGGHPESESPISDYLAQPLEEIKKVKEEKVIEGDLGGVNVEISKSDDLIEKGENNVEEKPNAEIPEKNSQDDKHSGQDGLQEFSPMDNIITSASNQIKIILQCFHVYVQCLRENDHQLHSCNEKLRSDETCRSGNVKLD